MHKKLLIETSDQGWGVLLSLSGSADVTQVRAIEERLPAVSQAKPRWVVVDLTGLEFISSLGVGVLVTLQNDIKPEGRMVLAGAVPDVASVFQRTRLTHVMPLFPTVDDAVRWVRGEMARPVA